MTLQEFETKIGKKVSELTLDDLAKMIADPEMITTLNEDTKFSIELANAVIETNNNDSVKAEFVPIKWHYALYESQITLSQMFAQYNNDKDIESLLNKLEGFLTGATPLGKLNAYLVCLTAFEDYDVSKKEDDVKETVKVVEDLLINEIDPKLAFPVACDIVDELYTVQQQYFERYNIDLIADDAERLNGYVEQLSKIAEPLYQQMSENMDEIVPEDAVPEDLGMLDVTKLKEKGEND